MYKLSLLPDAALEIKVANQSLLSRMFGDTSRGSLRHWESLALHQALSRSQQLQPSGRQKQG